MLFRSGSADHTEEVLSAYEGREDFRYIKNKQNMGAAGSRNKGVKLAQGIYIAFLDADDWWEKGKLKEQLHCLEETGYVLCSTGRELMRADGNSTGRTIPVKEKITYRELLKHNSINCSSVMLRTDVAREFPMEHDDSHEDYITWLKVLAQIAGGGALEQLNAHAVVQQDVQLQQLFLEQSLNAVLHTVDGIRAQAAGRLVHARQTGIDDGRGAAALADDDVLGHENLLLTDPKKFLLPQPLSARLPHGVRYALHCVSRREW